MNNKVIIGPLMLTRESETSINIKVKGEDNKMINFSLNLSEAAEIAQTITNWVFKSILE